MAARVTLQEGLSLAKGKFKFVKGQPQILSDEQARQFESDSRFVVRKLEAAGKKKKGAAGEGKAAKPKKGKGKGK
jgi:hypothetical protein